ncbi:MAG: acylneuraminate cytidylyltransferase family protein [Lachnospiraceae bacterium]|nr:acylneuraminate cytidylyltransferase family protein [Lachnospiraceae bacterium]
MQKLAIIPARSGSKGLPDKNIINLNEKPLMYYTIKAALASQCFDEVMVSTDSEKYAEIARQCGASVPFLRSPQMSGDHTDSWDSVREVLNNYKKMNKEFDYIALLQPTSPLRNVNDIKEIMYLIKDPDVHNAVAVTEVDHPIQWCFKLSENSLMDKMAVSPYSHMRRQELETYYRENGAAYIVNAIRIMDPAYNFYSDKCIAYIMPRERSIDIDTRMDLQIAGLLLREMNHL